MADETANPATPSGDYQAMINYWHLVDAILCGAEALRATPNTASTPGPQAPYAQLQQIRRYRPNESPYLPKFENEGYADYECRRENAPLTNIYGDISANLASKPFSKELQLAEGSPADLEKLAENVDGQGNTFHVFGRECFKHGLDKGISWIMVDYTKMPPKATLADERAKARPYWVQIQPERLLAVYSDFIGGQQLITHARISEPQSIRVGYTEVRRDRVRVLNREPVVDELNQVVGYLPATWELYEYIEDKTKNKADYNPWTLIDGGPITIGIIPLVPFMVGKRIGCTWQVDPPLRDLAFMQIEEFQQESNLKTIKQLTAFPMLAGNGVTPPVDSEGTLIRVPVGPASVLFAPIGGDGQHGEWTYIEPNAASLTFLQVDLEKIRTEMRNLGMQPMAEGNLTVVTTANVAMKASNAVEAWAYLFKDAMEQCWKLTCMWLNQDLEPEVVVHTDFGVDIQADAELTALISAEAAAAISKRTLQMELKRRGVLSDDFDPDAEEEELAKQQEGLMAEQAIDPVTGKQVTLQ